MCWMDTRYAHMQLFLLAPYHGRYHGTKTEVVVSREPQHIYSRSLTQLFSYLK